MHALPQNGLGKIQIANVIIAGRNEEDELEEKKNELEGYEYE
jgi:hypothetical protein